jgi:hypothetical protein
MENSIYLTLGQAAEMTGWSKGSLSKAIKSGKMSVYKKTTAGFQLDPAEVLRVFPKKTETLVIEQLETQEKHTENSALLGQVEALREKVAIVSIERTREREQLTDHIDSLQRMLDDEKSERRQLTALLTDQRQKRDELPAQGFWARVFR